MLDDPSSRDLSIRIVGEHDAVKNFQKLLSIAEIQSKVVIHDLQRYGNNRRFPNKSHTLFHPTLGCGIIESLEGLTATRNYAYSPNANSPYPGNSNIVPQETQFSK